MSVSPWFSGTGIFMLVVDYLEQHADVGTQSTVFLMTTSVWGEWRGSIWKVFLDKLYG